MIEPEVLRRCGAVRVLVRPGAPKARLWHVSFAFGGTRELWLVNQFAHAPHFDARARELLGAPQPRAGRIDLGEIFQRAVASPPPPADDDGARARWLAMTGHERRARYERWLRGGME